MTPVLRTERLSKAYRRHQALIDASLDIPPGRVVGLVGPNGAGKSTLLGLTCGLITPTSGAIEVLGAQPAANAAQLAKVGFVAQDAPVYGRLSVADHLRLGNRLNPGWDQNLARRRIQQIGLDPTRKAGHLSGGERAQLALTIAAAKRPKLLIFDEPVAALDPLARRGFLQNLMEFVAELGVNVLLSSHLLSDLERVCDHLIVLASSRVQLAGDVDDLLAAHYRLTGARGDFGALPADSEVISAEHTPRQSSLIIRTNRPLGPITQRAEHLGLEDLVLVYMTQAAAVSDNRSARTAVEAHR